MGGDDAWHDTTVTHVTHGLPTQFQRRPYVVTVRPPPTFHPAPVKTADDAEKRRKERRNKGIEYGFAEYGFGPHAVARLLRAARLCFWCLLVLVPAVLAVLYLPELMSHVFGLDKVPTSDGGGHILVRARVLDSLEEHCKQGVKAMLVSSEVSAEAALDPLRQCREFAEQAVAKEHRAVGSKMGGRGFAGGGACLPLIATTTPFIHHLQHNPSNITPPPT
jgi:hypothetical protein